MFIIQSTYRKILLIALVVLLAVPCTVKGEFKQWLDIASNQQTKLENSRIVCSSFVQQERQVLKQKGIKVILPNALSDFKYRSALVVSQLQFQYNYSSHKEKIPSYLLFERFLI